jgi:hypothetical protein
VDIPPQAIAVFGSMSGFSYYYGAPTPAPPYDANLDTSVNAIVGNSSSATAGALRAAYLPKWKAGTAYASGEPVLNPSGQTVTANAAFTSGATYDSSKWTIVSGSGGGGGAVSSVAGRTGAVTLAAADLTDATTVGKAVLTAADGPAARAAIGAGTSSLALGTTSATAKRGDYAPASTDISDATAIGKALLTAADAAAERTALGLGSAATLAVGTTAGTVAAGDDSRFGTGIAQSLYGATAQPWKPSPAIGPELWQLANFIGGTGKNTTSLTPSVTATGSQITLATRFLLNNLANHDTAYRLSFNVSGTPTTGGYYVSAALTDSSSNLWAGTTEQKLAGNSEGYGVTGVHLMEFMPSAASINGGVYLEVRMVVQNNVTAGQILSINNVSVREIAQVTRPMRYGAIASYANQSLGVHLYDPVAKNWRMLFHTFSSDGNLTNGLTNADGTFSDQPFNNVMPDPAFAATMTTNGPLSVTGLTSGGYRSVRANNNDQILEVLGSDGTTWTLRGNTHGGEVNSSPATWQADLNDGNGWLPWDGTSTFYRPAVRFQMIWPTTISRPAPDSDAFANVTHTTTFFPNGVMRMDRTTTFTKSVTLRSQFDWMSSHSTITPKIGRVGRGLIVGGEIDIFPKVAAPAVPTVTTAATGGGLAAATYVYAVTALSEAGETTASATASVAATGTTSANTIAWSTVAGATGYRVYGRTSTKGLGLLATVGPAVTSWIDDGTGAAVAPQPPATNTARQLAATTFVQDAAITSTGYWAVWYDPILDMCYANIYDRDSVLSRTGVLATKSRLEGAAAIVKSYLNSYWTGNSDRYTVPTNTVWTVTHWSYAYIPQDKKNYHLEAALLATDLAALKANYPAS